MSKRVTFKIKVDYDDAIELAYPDSQDPMRSLSEDLLEGLKVAIEEGLFCNHPMINGIPDQLAMEIIERCSVDINGVKWSEEG